MTDQQPGRRIVAAQLNRYGGGARQQSVIRTYFAFVSGGDVGVPKEEQLRILLDKGQ